MTGQEAIASLQGLLAQALYYARQSQAGRNSDPLKETSTALWITQFNALDFDPPNAGYQVTDGKLDWKEWAKRFQGAVEDLIAYRATFGFDGHEVVIDSGVSVAPNGDVYMSSSDPMVKWWHETAAGALQSLAISDTIDWVLTPVKEGAKAIGGALDFAAPAVIIIIIILVLILAIKLT